MDNIYVAISVKMLAGFILVAGYIRLSGKGSLAPISALDQVDNVVLGAIIGGSLYNTGVSLFFLVFVAGARAGMILLVRFITVRQWSIKNAMDGKSIKLMEDGRILTENFKKARLSPRDFIMLLHQRGYSDLNGLANVWFEYNGQMSVVKKGDKEMAVVLVEGGQADTDNLESLGLDEKWLNEELKKQNWKMEDIFLAEWHDDRLWIYPQQGASPTSREKAEI